MAAVAAILKYNRTAPKIDRIIGAAVLQNSTETLQTNRLTDAVCDVNITFLC
jgi:hypothetical protein